MRWMKPGVGSFHSWSPCILHSLQNLLQQFYQKRKIFVAISFSFKVGSPLTYLNFTTLPVHLYVLWEMPRASHCVGFRNLCFFTHKISRRAWRFFYQTVIDSFNRSAIITLVSYCHIRRIHCFVVFRRMMILKPGCISVSVLFSKMTLTSTG